MEWGSLKPVLGLLVLPPGGPLLLVFAGVVPAWRRKWQGVLLALLGATSMALLCCNAVAVLLATHALPQVSALTPADISALRSKGVQAIVVLGGGVERQAQEYGQAQPAGSTAARLRYGVWLSRQTGIPLAFSGGVGWANDSSAASEAEVADRAAKQDYGVAIRWVEQRSRDTAQNARLTQALLAADGVKQIALVTNAWHMPRALGDFSATGLQVTPAPMGFVTPRSSGLLEWLPTAQGLASSQVVLREWLALQVYRLSFPGTS
jgi:uncharacterized SAM-binding protein YcdF (DUF218 family)